MENLKQAQVRPKFFQNNPLLCNFSLQLIFFSEQPFYGNYSALDSHTNTEISHVFFSYLAFNLTSFFVLSTTKIYHSIKI